jgi:hypothetical protein
MATLNLAEGWSGQMIYQKERAPVKFIIFIIFGSSPNSLRVKELVFLKCQVIAGARKESHIACNHEASVSS